MRYLQMALRACLFNENSIAVSRIIHSSLFDISPTTTPTQESEEHLLDGIG